MKLSLKCQLKQKKGKGKCYKTDLTTEIGALSTTSIFARAEILKNSECGFLIQHMVLHINLNDSHTFLIQALWPSCQTDTPLRLTSGCQISQSVWCFPDSKTLSRDLTHQHYLIYSIWWAVELKCVWPQTLQHQSWSENGEALTMCWWPKTKLRNAANCLKPQKTATWASMASGLLLIQGHRGHTGNISVGSIR